MGEKNGNYSSHQGRGINGLPYLLQENDLNINTGCRLLETPLSHNETRNICR